MKTLLPLLSFLLACSDAPAARVDAHDSAAPDVEGDASPDAADTAEATDTVPDTALPPLDLGEPIPEGRVVAGVATRPEHLVQGPKAEGMLGDLVLANARARFVVEGARRAGGYRMWGGYLVDVAIDGLPDRFGELWFAWNLLAFVPTDASVVSSGADGVAHVRLSGRTGAYPWPDSFLRPLLTPEPADLAVTYDYRLAPDSTRLELTVTLENDGDDRADVELPLVAMNMGDGVESFTPGGGFGAVQASPDMRWLGALGLEASYAIAADTTMGGVFSYANMDIVRLPRFVIAPGTSHQLVFDLVASSDGTGGLEAALPDSPATTVMSGTVSGPSDGAWVALTDEGTVGALALVRADGTWQTRVPPGSWTAQAFAPGLGGSPPIVLAEGETRADLELPEPATLVVTVRDLASGAPIPAQLTLFRAPETPSPFAPAPVRMDRDWGDGRTNIVFATSPATRVRVPAGRYDAVASRGYSYELAAETLDLAPGEELAVDLALERVVDTAGWSAADFHLHAQWSSDSDVPYDVRVRQAAANEVDLPVLTEHAYVGDLLSAAELAGVSDFVAAIPAQEVTTFEYGHFNAFPLVYDPDAPSGGAVFEHGLPGAELFTSIRAQQPDDVLIQVNHPRSSTSFFGYFNFVGLDTASGVAAKPARFTTDWDLLEVFNGRCLGSAANERTRQDWIDLTNLGWKKTLSSGSDSHSEASGIGHPRSWVAVERAAVALDAQAIVAPLRARRTFVSCGPFVRFAAADGTGLGGLTEVDDDGTVTFAVTVEAPTWIGVDAVVLLENGVPIHTWEAADPHAGPDPSRPALRFDGTFAASPSRDAWYAVEVLGSGSLSPVEMGEGPYALTNPIEVDQDRDGVWSAPGGAAGTRR